MPSITVALLLSACGGASTSSATHAPARATTTQRARTAHPVRALAAQPAGQLPAGVQWPAAARVGGRVLLMGGLDQATASMSDIISASPAVAERVGALPYAVHDAAGATLGGRAYLLGGGEPSYSNILAVDPSGRASVVGQLPAAASDVAAGVIG